MNPRDEKWPIKKEFFVEIEDHSEDGCWSGYAHSEEFPRGMDHIKAVLLEPDTVQVPRDLWEEIKADFQFSQEQLELIERLGL